MADRELVTEDEIFEDLPPKLRKRVLKYWATGQDEDDVPQAKQVYRSQFKWWKLGLAYLWAAPWAIVGVVLSATVIGLPLGLPMIFIGCYPVAKMLSPKALPIDKADIINETSDNTEDMNGRSTNQSDL